MLHCFFLPTLVLLLFSWHMWRVRKDGGLACVDGLAPAQRREPFAPAKAKTYSLLGITKGRTVHVETSLADFDRLTVDSSPHLMRRLLLVSLATVLVCSLLALFVAAPLEEPANPRVTPNPAKAPWYFLWLQELVTDTTLRIGDFTINGALIGGIILPGVLVVVLALWPFFDRSSVNAVGVWFASERKAQNTVFLIGFAIVLILTVLGTFLRGPSWRFYWPWESWPQSPTRF